MNYGITIVTDGDWAFLAITSEEFGKVKLARANLLAALGSEEKCELLIENFTEYEREVFGIAQRRLLKGGSSWAASLEDMLLLNRRLVNVLTAARMYADQIKHDINSIYGSVSKVADRVRESLSREYDEAL